MQMKKLLTPIKTIRKKCLDCCCGSTKAIKYCTCYSCRLWPYRFGLMPRTAQKKYKKFMNPDKMPSSDIDIERLS